MKDYLSTYSGKRVLVTGHTGFKGSWLTYLLKEIGADVKGYALSPKTNPSHFELLELSKEIDHVEADIRDLDDVSKAVDDFKPEIIFHLAAQALVRQSYNDPVETFETNVMGSVNLLRSIMQSDSVRSLVFITSDKCYENVEWVWGYREEDRLGGYDPYSASKASAEIVFSAFYRSFLKEKENFGAATARAGNVIGGGDWSDDRIIPDCIRAIQSDEPIFLRNPNATRPWQHVLEPISGYLKLGSMLYQYNNKYEGAWNFGPLPSEVRTVEDITRSMIEYIGRGKIELDDDIQKVHEANLLQLNIDKAMQKLDWKPRWTPEETIKKTADWFKIYLDGGDVKEVTKQHIYDYFSELQ